MFLRIRYINNVAFVSVWRAFVVDFFRCLMWRDPTGEQNSFMNWYPVRIYRRLKAKLFNEYNGLYKNADWFPDYM